MRLSELRLPLDHQDDDLTSQIIRRLRIKSSDLKSTRIYKRSIDARNHEQIQVVYSVDVEVYQESQLLKRHLGSKGIRKTPEFKYEQVAKFSRGFYKTIQRPVVVGAGPCGYFAALTLAQMGLRPLLIERGKAVKERTLDTFAFWKGHSPFNPDSNAQFGEGGAGTF